MGLPSSTCPCAWSRGTVALICLAFLATRLPVVWHAPGGQDEDWFAVPGYTVAFEGVPRIPYAPERNRESFFWKADVALFALPPAYHYFQAPFFWLFPAGYGTARLASCLAGVISIILVYQLGRRLLQDDLSAVIACGLYSLSRVFYFPAIIARPDMLCTMLGLASLITILNWTSTGSRRWLAVTGVLLGLAGLTHPFALVIALQVGFWVLYAGVGNWQRRLSDLFLLVGVTLAVFALWTPLIAAYPDIFHEQFIGNVLSRKNPAEAKAGSLWTSFQYQAGLVWEHAGPIQTCLMLFGLLWITGRACLFRMPADRRLAGLTISGILLLVLLQGRHPTKGYWSYPSALMFLCLGCCIRDFAWRFSQRRMRLTESVLGLLLAILMVPGGGFRTTVATLRHWNDPNYNPRRFVRRILEQTPPNEVLIVDPAFVFDVWLAGRKTILGVNLPYYFHAAEFPYDILIVSRFGLDHDVPQQLNGRRIAEYGTREDPFACYAEIYQPAGVEREEE